MPVLFAPSQDAILRIDRILALSQPSCTQSNNYLPRRNQRMISDSEMTCSATLDYYKMSDVHRPTAQHILDEHRRAALAKIDDAPWSYVLRLLIFPVHINVISMTLTCDDCICPYSWEHFKVCTVAGVGFFTDAYVHAVRSTHLTLFIEVMCTDMTASPSALRRLCWAMSMARVILCLALDRISVSR